MQKTDGGVKILKGKSVKRVDVYVSMDVAVWRNYTFATNGSERMSFVPSRPFGLVMVMKRFDDPSKDVPLYAWILYRYAQLDVTYPWYIDVEVMPTKNVDMQGWYRAHEKKWVRVGIKP